jgi:cation:H+ antiporter
MVAMITAVWITAGVSGLALALAASRRAVHHASALAFGSRTPPFLIGMTLVALGTDLPEIANSVVASLRGYGDVNVSDSIGSAATQITLILALLPLTGGPFPVGRRRVALIGWLTVGALATGLLLVADGDLSRLDGLVLIGCWVGSSLLVWRHAPAVAEPTLIVPAHRKARHVAKALGAMGFVAGGAWVAIEALLRVAAEFEVPVYVIGFFAASLGTSLPELLVDLTAYRSGQRDLAIGGLFGASLIDSTLSIGIGPTVAPTAVSADLAVRGGIGALVAVAFVTILLGFRRRHTRFTGFLLLIAYGALYLVLLGD